MVVVVAKPYYGTDGYSQQQQLLLGNTRDITHTHVIKREYLDGIL